MQLHFRTNIQWLWISSWIIRSAILELIMKTDLILGYIHTSFVGEFASDQWEQKVFMNSDRWNLSFFLSFLLLEWDDIPHRSLVSSAVRLKISLSLAGLTYSLIFSSNEECLPMFSSHPYRSLSTGILPWNIPFNTFFSILELSIQTIWPAHFNPLNFIHFTISGRSISV